LSRYSNASVLGLGCSDGDRLNACVEGTAEEKLQLLHVDTYERKPRNLASR
jgi:hypothetical protein